MPSGENRNFHVQQAANRCGDSRPAVDENSLFPVEINAERIRILTRSVFCIKWDFLWNDECFLAGLITINVPPAHKEWPILINHNNMRADTINPRVKIIISARLSMVSLIIPLYDTAMAFVLAIFISISIS